MLVGNFNFSFYLDDKLIPLDSTILKWAKLSEDFINSLYYFEMEFSDVLGLLREGKIKDFQKCFFRFDTGETVFDINFIIDVINDFPVEGSHLTRIYLRGVSPFFYPLIYIKKIESFGSVSASTVVERIFKKNQINLYSIDKSKDVYKYCQLGLSDFDFIKLLENKAESIKGLRDFFFFERFDGSLLFKSLGNLLASNAVFSFSDIPYKGRQLISNTSFANVSKDCWEDTFRAKVYYYDFEDIKEIKENSFFQNKIIQNNVEPFFYSKESDFSFYHNDGYLLGDSHSSDEWRRRFATINIFNNILNFSVCGLGFCSIGDLVDVIISNNYNQSSNYLSGLYLIIGKRIEIYNNFGQTVFKCVRNANYE